MPLSNSLSLNFGIVAGVMGFGGIFPHVPLAAAFAVGAVAGITTGGVTELCRMIGDMKELSSKSDGSGWYTTYPLFVAPTVGFVAGGATFQYVLPAIGLGS